MILDLFKKSRLRIGLLVLLGICLSLSYWHSFLEDYFIAPLSLGVIVGLLSHRFFEGLMNSVIVIIAMSLTVLVEPLAIHFGFGAGHDREYYLDTLAIGFESAVFIFMFWLPGVALGLILRQLFLFLQRREKNNKAT